MLVLIIKFIKLSPLIYGGQAAVKDTAREMMDYWNWLKEVDVGDWAGWLGLLVALPTLWYGAKQIQWSREDSRESTAIQTWMEYYLRCLEYPEYACPDLLKLGYNNPDKRESNKQNEERYKYQWFVSFMLLACDQVIRLPKGKGGPNWEQFVRNNVGYHRDYLTSLYFEEGYKPPFSPELISKVKEVLGEIREKQKSEGP